mmetsp:Transcript_156395/g.501722  ORF Transcript_156395/g.501722 Transcript_156395/m.501722 type:complete len:425 (+) Transcript_156395:137-1411(+)
MGIHSYMFDKWLVRCTHAPSTLCLPGRGRIANRGHRIPYYATREGGQRHRTWKRSTKLRAASCSCCLSCLERQSSRRRAARWSSASLVSSRPCLCSSSEAGRDAKPGKSGGSCPAKIWVTSSADMTLGTGEGSGPGCRSSPPRRGVSSPPAEVSSAQLCKVSSNRSNCCRCLRSAAPVRCDAVSGLTPAEAARRWGGAPTPAPLLGLQETSCIVARRWLSCCSRRFVDLMTCAHCWGRAPPLSLAAAACPTPARASVAAAAAGAGVAASAARVAQSCSCAALSCFASSAHLCSSSRREVWEADRTCSSCRARRRCSLRAGPAETSRHLARSTSQAGATPAAASAGGSSHLKTSAPSPVDAWLAAGASLSPRGLLCSGSGSFCSPSTASFAMPAELADAPSPLCSESWATAPPRLAEVSDAPSAR